MDHVAESDLYSIVLVEVATAKRFTLVRPSIRPLADHILGFSPDGRQLAFVNGEDISIIEINTQSSPPSAGAIRPLTENIRTLYGFAWLPDKGNILFSADRAGGPTLWQMSIRPRSLPERLQMEGLYALRPAISRQTPGKPSRLAYERLSRRANLWRIELSETSRGAPRTMRVAPSKRGDASPQFSPDGVKIAFCSHRNGPWEVFVANRDGSDLVTLPSPGEYSCSPRWSPDGRQVVFDSLAGGNRDIYVAEPSGSPVRRLTSEPSEESRPSWSRDGQWIYFCSDRTAKGEHEIWKTRADGSGHAIQVTHHGGFEAFESFDRRYLYYVRSNKEPGLWRMPREGGSEVPVLESVSEGHWSITANGIYFMPFGASETSRTIQYSSFTSPTTPKMVYRTAGDASKIYPGLSVTADGRYLVVPLEENQTSEIEVVNNLEANLSGSNSK
jgi:Tol biopolymer transport system component